VAFDPLTAGTTTVSAEIPGYISIPTASLEVVVSAPAITLYAPDRVGSGLQTSGSFYLGAGNHGGVTVTLTSSDPAKLRLSTDPAVEGAGSIDIFMADGQTSSPYFYVQALEGLTGTVTLTASAPGFTDDTDPVEILQPVVQLTGLSTPTTTLSDEDPFRVQVGIAANGVNWTQAQDVRAGADPLTATLTSSHAAVGQLVTLAQSGASVTVQIVPGEDFSPSTVAGGGVAFDPLTAGTTTVSAEIPGYISIPTASLKVVVTEE
jgi:hypothetical protein